MKQPLRVILKDEYLHSDWDAIGLQPLTCQRPYVEYYEDNDSGGVTLKETGPFDGVTEAHEWISKQWKLYGDHVHPHVRN